MQQYATHGDMTTRDTTMKVQHHASTPALTCVTVCSCRKCLEHTSLAFPSSSILLLRQFSPRFSWLRTQVSRAGDAACNQSINEHVATIPSTTIRNRLLPLSIDEMRELSLDILATHVRKTSTALQLQHLQLLLPLLLQWLQSFGPENDFVVPATQSACELVAAAMQHASSDVLQACAPVIASLVQWLLQPHLQERAIIYAPKVFAQALMKLGAAVDARGIIIAMANRQVESNLPDLM